MLHGEAPVVSLVFEAFWTVSANLFPNGEEIWVVHVNEEKSLLEGTLQGTFEGVAPEAPDKNLLIPRLEHFEVTSTP